MNTTNPNPRRFALCICEYDEELDVRPGHVYEVLPDTKAEALGMIRVIDDSGEDYLYPDEYFKADSTPQRLASAS